MCIDGSPKRAAGPVEVNHDIHDLNIFWILSIKDLNLIMGKFQNHALRMLTLPRRPRPLKLVILKSSAETKAQLQRHRQQQARAQARLP